MPKNEFGSMSQAREQSAQTWDEYGRIRDSNNYEIERLRAEANSEHQQMLETGTEISNSITSVAKDSLVIEIYEYGTTRGTERQEV